MRTRDVALPGPATPAAHRWIRVLRITHPFPTLLNAAATAGLAFVAVRGAPSASTLLRMATVMLLIQSAIGITNDIIDRDLDAATKPWKPVAAGFVSVRAATTAALAAGAIAALIAATLGAPSFALAMLGLAIGLAYDLRLKRTSLSALPYSAGIPLLPVWVWVTLDAWQPVLWWVLPIGALVGLALHLANSVPDLRDDAAHGVFGLAYRLGAGRSIALAWASFALALTLSLALAPFATYDLRLYAPAAAFAALTFAASVALHLSRRDDASLQFAFGALGIGAAVLAAGWLAAVT